MDIDMTLINEALARRAGENSPVGGVGVPVANQMSSPGGIIPSGRPNTPNTETPTPPPGQGAPLASINSAMKKTQAISSQVDDETKMLSKALVKKLLDVIS